MLVDADDNVGDLSGNFCVWLASPEARPFHGRFLFASWDVEELLARQEEILASRQLYLGIEGVSVELSSPAA